MINYYSQANGYYTNTTNDRTDPIVESVKTKYDQRRLQRTYNSEQVMNMLALSKSKLDKLCHLNEIPYHVYEGQRKRYFLEDDLIAFQQGLIRRSKLGIDKYNTTLYDNPDGFYKFLNHLQEELMDATLYIEKLKKINEGK